MAKGPKKKQQTAASPKENSRQVPAPETRRPVIPDNYVEQAEVFLKDESIRNAVTTSRLRNLLSLASAVYNVENLRTEERLLQDSVSKLKLMWIRTVYECGRDRGTRTFVERTNLLEYLKQLSSANRCVRQDLIDFYHYMEALVAFHRYYGGRENGSCTEKS